MLFTTVYKLAANSPCLCCFVSILSLILQSDRSMHAKSLVSLPQIICTVLTEQLWHFTWFVLVDYKITCLLSNKKWYLFKLHPPEHTGGPRGPPTACSELDLICKAGYIYFPAIRLCMAAVFFFLLLHLTPSVWAVSCWRAKPQCTWTATLLT